MAETIELAEKGEAVILLEASAESQALVGLLLRTHPTEIHASDDLPSEANLRIALRPRDAQQLARSLHRAAKRCLKSQRLH